MLFNEDIAGRVDHDLADLRIEDEPFNGTEIWQNHPESRMKGWSRGWIGGSQRHEKTPSPWRMLAGTMTCSGSRTGLSARLSKRKSVR